MQQGLQQGQDYYDYMTSRQRPVEDALQQNALKDTSAADAAERAAITGAQGDYANTIGSIGSRRVAGPFATLPLAKGSNSEWWQKQAITRSSAFQPLSVHP